MDVGTPRLVLATERRLGFIRKVLLESWVQGAAAALRAPPRASTWAREPGCPRPAPAGRVRRAAPPPG